DVLVLADEIHADLLLGGISHTPLAALAPHRVITAVAPSKTFNIPGLGLSVLIAANTAHRQSLQSVFNRWHVSAYNPFSQAAFVAAYRHGQPWLDALLNYLLVSRDQVLARLLEVMPVVESTRPEATYLLWLDFSKLNLGDSALQQRLVDVGLGLNPGPSFGRAGQGHMRLNFAAPRSQVMDAINRLAKL
ncbi:MAG: aminotransferase class I/II-fold pyridoxal phosphate-dependent enzyme, partial [Pseudomonadales bacterium]|nr:aminotransferase class I/II-fold pyridoxal phosphate-dependent enzyme [Pseudomonadales bacterium]